MRLKTNDQTSSKLVPVSMGSPSKLSSMEGVATILQARNYVINSTSPDVDIPSIDTTVVPTARHIQGPITRSRAKQLNYQVLSFLGTIPHIHENMMLPKSDVFLTLRNDGPSMDERDKHWSMARHGDGSKHVMIQEKATDGDFRTLRPP